MTALEPLDMGCADVAAALGVPLETFRDWRKRGRAPRGYKFGRTVRFRSSEVAAWIKQQKETT